MPSKPQRANQPWIARRGRRGVADALIRVIFITTKTADFRLHPQFVANGAHRPLDHRALRRKGAEVESGEGGGVDGAIELQRSILHGQSARETGFIFDPEMADHRIANFRGDRETSCASLLFVE